MSAPCRQGGQDHFGHWLGAGFVPAGKAAVALCEPLVMRRKEARLAAAKALLRLLKQGESAASGRSAGDGTGAADGASEAGAAREEAWRGGQGGEKGR